MFYDNFEKPMWKLRSKTFVGNEILGMLSRKGIWKKIVEVMSHV
jgi:hypothetical protein